MAQSHVWNVITGECVLCGLTKFTYLTEPHNHPHRSCPETKTPTPTQQPILPTVTPAPICHNRASTLPTEPKERKKFPIATGVLDYFPDAMVAVAHVSFMGNEQHNPGQPLHWARGKSMDQEDTMIRHYLQRGTLDTDGIPHTAKMVWRALAILQLECEERNSHE